MGRLADKIILIALSVYAMLLIQHGISLLITIYSAIAFTAVGYYLLTAESDNYEMKTGTVREKVAFVMEIAATAAVAVFPEYAAALPVVMYDTARSRNYIAAILSIAALIRSFSVNETGITCLIIILTLLAAYLSIKSEKNNLLISKYHQIRDDSEEKKSRLRSQNVALEKAMDTEVYNAQLSERNRIAREIHDNVGHMLSRALLQMGALLAIHKEEPTHTQLEGVRETLDSAMNNIRSSVHDLHDESIDVENSIRQMAEPLEERFNVSIEMDFDSRNTPRNVKYAIIGIVREAIANVIKHSRSTDVNIKCVQHPSMYQLIIHDFVSEATHEGTAKWNKSVEAEMGKSVEAESGKSVGAEMGKSVEAESEKAGGNKDGGIGLENIRSRAESVGGTCNIITDNGFKVFVTIPLK